MNEKIKKEIELLTNQKEQAKEVYIKCIGALEVLGRLLEEDVKKPKIKKDNSGT